MGGGQTLHLFCKAGLARLERLEELDHTIELPQEGMMFFQMFITNRGNCDHKPPFFKQYAQSLSTDGCATSVTLNRIHGLPMYHDENGKDRSFYLNYIHVIL
jgi:hypothetical protein